MHKFLALLASSMLAACGSIGDVHREPETDDATPKIIVDGLAALSKQHRLLILGETHGSQEVPVLVLATAQRLLEGNSSVVVALEIPERMQRNLSNFLTADDPENVKARLFEDAFWTWRDGRSSQAMLALIEGLGQLRRAGHDVSIHAFDANDAPSGTERERTMADNLRRGFLTDTNARYLVLTGNYHARIQKGAPWDDALELMAYQLRDLAPLAINVSAPTGSVWVCNPDCGEYAFGVEAVSASPALTVFEQLSEHGYSGEVVLPSFSASPPARE